MLLKKLNINLENILISLIVLFSTIGTQIFFTVTESKKNYLNGEVTKNLNSIISLDSNLNKYTNSENPVIKIGQISKKSFKLTNDNLNTVLKDNSDFIKYGYIFNYSCLDMCKINLIASTKDFIKVLNLQILEGSWFSDNDYAEKYHYIAITKKYAEENFKEKNPIGNYIKGKLVSFKIIAVFESNMNSFFYNETTPYGSIGLIPYNSNPESVQISDSPIRLIPKYQNSGEAVNKLNSYVEKNWQSSIYVNYNLDTNLNSSLIFEKWFTFIFLILIIVISSFSISNLNIKNINHQMKYFSIKIALGSTKFDQFISIFKNNLYIYILIFIISIPISNFLITLINQYLITNTSDFYINKSSGFLPYHFLFIIIGFGITNTIAFVNFSQRSLSSNLKGD